MKSKMIAAMLVLFGGLCIAADVPQVVQPKSPAAVAALDKFRAAKKKAGDDYTAAMNSATVVALQELDAAKVAAMKNTNLDEANAIAAVAKKIASSKGDKSSESPAEIVARVKNFRYQWGGNKPRDFEFLPNGAIGKGAAGQEKFWQAKESSIILSDHAASQLELFQCADGVFRGVNSGGTGLTLTPEGQ